MVIVGGLVFVGALALLPYLKFNAYSFRAGSVTLWGLYTREPLVLTLVAVAAIALAVRSLFTGARSPLLLAACFSFYLFGRVFPIESASYEAFDTGFWLATGAAVTMSVGGILAVVAGGFTNPLAKPS